MIPFEINIQSGNLEVVAKITGLVDLIGGAYCKDVVEAVVIDRVQSQFVAL